MSGPPVAELTLGSGSPEQTQALAGALVPFLRNGDVVLLCGDLGAGKTVFTQGLARSAGVGEAVTSPTFTLVHRYPTAIGLDLLHADVYRLETAAEIADLGLAEMVEEDAFALVEWGERAVGVFGPDHLLVTLTAPEPAGEAAGEAAAAPDGEAAEAPPRTRHIAVRPVGGSWTERWAELEPALRSAAPTSAAPTVDETAAHETEVTA